MGEPVEESHQHVLGECLQIVPQLDELWKEILGLLTHLQINTTAINPWFHCSGHYEGLYEMPAYLGDKGLLPKELRNNIKRVNQNIDAKKLDKAMRGIMYLVKNRMRAIYLSRFR
jgi:hypothetical protein